METIHKGYAFPMVISSSATLDLRQSRLFNHASKSSIALGTPAFQATNNGTTEYQAILDADKTALLPCGVYDLELRTPYGYMAKHIPSFAKVVETAIVNI